MKLMLAAVQAPTILKNEVPDATVMQALLWRASEPIARCAVALRIQACDLIQVVQKVIGLRISGVQGLGS